VRDLLQTMRKDNQYVFTVHKVLNSWLWRQDASLFYLC